MFKYTKAAIIKTIDDIKKTAQVFGFILAFFQIPFSIYNLILENGIQAVNIAFLILSSVYFIIYLISSLAISENSDKKERKKWKQLKTKTKRIVKWVKRPIQLYSLVLLIYGIVIATNEASAISVILLFLQILMFLCSFIIDVIAIIIDKKKQFFLEAWEADWNDIKEPGRVVGNVVKSFFGKETTPQPKASKTELTLNEYIEKQNEKKAKAKADAKAQKKQEKLAKKEEKKKEKEIATTEDNTEKKGWFRK